MTTTGDTQTLDNDLQNRPDTLERLLSFCATRYAQKTALCDPPNRNQLEGRSDGLPSRLFTFKSLDHMVTKIANSLRSMGLQPGDHVLMQLPNFVETPILVLAMMRARLIPCLVPLSWSNEEISRSFDRLKPKALLSCGQLEGVNYSERMRDLAFSHLHIRFVLGVGYDIADGITDLSAMFDPQAEEDLPQGAPDRDNTDLNDLALVTYIDAATPVPHYNGQILATGLLHVLSLDLSSDDHILSAYPLSSIPGLAAHFYPWLLSGSCLSLHHPFAFEILREQIQSEAFSYFSAPEQVIDWMLTSGLPTPRKLAIVRRDKHMAITGLENVSNTQFFDLWNLGGLGSVPVKYTSEQSAPLFPNGRTCLPSDKVHELCLAAAKVDNNRLYIKGRIFPNKASINTSLEWISLSKRFEEDWLDTGLQAVAGPNDSILLGPDAMEELRQVAS